MAWRYHIFASDNPTLRLLESDWYDSTNTLSMAKKLADEIKYETGKNFVEVWDFTNIPPRKVLEVL